MPNQLAAKPRHKGWWLDQINNRLVAVFNGTEIFDFDGNDVVITQATTITGAQTLTGLTTLTAGATTPLAYTSTRVGNAFVAATGNVAIGNPAAFATTQPQGAVHMGGTSLGGIAPVGTTATSGAVFASDTAVMKIVAGGTADTIQT